MAEIELWVETSRYALSKMGGGLGGRTEAPWRKLLEAGRIVGLEGEEWGKVVEATLGVKSDEDWEGVMLEVVRFTEMGREEVGQVLKTRSDLVW